MVDTVSKNGTFILNIPGMPDGTIDSNEIAVLDGITLWIDVNGEAIYETRPWKVYGEGPNSVKAGAFGGNSVTKLGAKDIRFTRNKANTTIYAHVLGRQSDPVLIQPMGTSAETKPGKLATNALHVELSKQYQPVVDCAAVLKITLA